MSTPIDPNFRISIPLSFRVTPEQHAALGSTPAERTATLRAFAQSLVTSKASQKPAGS